MAFRGIQTTNIISTDVGFSDPLLILNKDGIQATDVGFLGKLGPTTYAGLVRDSETSNFLLLDSIELAPSTINDVSALDASIVKGSITVGTLTADTIIAGNIPSTLSDLTDIDNGSATTGDLILYDGSTWSYVNLESEINTRITASQNSQSLIGLSDVGHTSDTVANGDFLLYDSSTSKFAFVDFASEVNAYADARVGVALSNTVSLTGSLNGNVTGRLYGDVHGDVTSPTSLVPIITTGPVKDTLTIHDAEVEKLKAPSSSGGATIVNTTGADTFFGHNAYLTGSLYGDIGDTLANSPVLTVGTGNNDSQLAVTVASIDELQVNDSYILPKGTAAQRPASPVEGMMWFNTTTKMFEGYDGTAWVQLVPSTFQSTP